MLTLAKIVQPTCLIHKNRVIHNIRRMADKAKKNQVRFRPHFKTHQSAEIGNWFRDFGVEAITVSSMEMALYFAEHGWKDITVAFPVNLREIDKINDLARRIMLNLLVESPEAVEFLKHNLQNEVGLWIKIDAGYRRTGIPWSNADQIIQLSQKILQSANLRYQGLLTHAGHTYEAASKEDIETLFQQSVLRLNEVRTWLTDAKIESVAISVGDTPGCTVMREFGNIDEIRPGNFVFYDAMQMQSGVCREQDIALALACPVVAKHPERNEMVIYGGAVYLSKDYLEKAGSKIFGYVAPLDETGWGQIIPNTYVASLSQEHGIIKTTEAFLQQINIGDLLAVIPVHSCLTANLAKKYMTLDGEILQMMIRHICNSSTPLQKPI